MRLSRLFTQHPRENRESYSEHFCFTIQISARLVYAGLIILVHGVFPFIFTRKASTEIMKIYDIMSARIPGASSAQDDFHYVI